MVYGSPAGVTAPENMTVKCQLSRPYGGSLAVLPTVTGHTMTRQKALLSYDGRRDLHPREDREASDKRTSLHPFVIINKLIF